MLDVGFDGQSLLDQGFFTSYNALSGMALNTMGFLIAAGEIWTPWQFTITTIWTEEPV